MIKKENEIYIMLCSEFKQNLLSKLEKPDQNSSNLNKIIEKTLNETMQTVIQINLEQLNQLKEDLINKKKELKLKKIQWMKLLTKLKNKYQSKTLKNTETHEKYLENILKLSETAKNLKENLTSEMKKIEDGKKKEFLIIKTAKKPINRQIDLQETQSPKLKNTKAPRSANIIYLENELAKIPSNEQNPKQIREILDKWNQIPVEIRISYEVAAENELEEYLKRIGN